MKRIVLSISLLMGGVFGINAQDIHFSQFNETPLLLNPATAGFYDGYERVILNHKSQWTSIGSPFRTTAASFDLPFFFGYGTNAHIGAGISFYNDMAGDSKFGTNQGILSLSGILPVDDRTKFAAGIQFGLAQRSGSLEGLTWGNQFVGDGFNTDIASNEANTLNSFMYADIGGGIQFQFDNTSEKFDGYDEFRIDIGAAILHANKPLLKYTDAPTDQLPLKMLVTFRMRYDIPGSTVSFVPQFMYVRQSPHQEIYGGAGLRFQLQNGTKYTGLVQENALTIGIQTRVKDAITPTVLIELTDYAFGFSYDLSVSKLGTTNAAAGGFEVTLRYINMRDALWKRKTQGSFR